MSRPANVRSRLLWLTLLCLLAPSPSQAASEVPVRPPAVPALPPPPSAVPAPPDILPLETVPVTPAPPATPGPVPSAPTFSPSTLRGLWIDGFGTGLRTPEQVQQAVSDAAGLGINALFVQALRRADCLCLRAGVPVAADIAPGFDPLALIIRLAHARGIRVIGWYSVTGAWNVTLPSAGKTQVFAAHGPDAGRNSWLSRRPDGSWRETSDGWLDPGIPAAADYMATAALNLVRNYDLDGLQLDRIRYPDGGEWGYSPVTLGRYRAETGQTGTPAPADPRWKAWKREQVTALVRRIALEARAAKPGLLMTAATIVYGDGPADLSAFQKTRSYSEVLQDWPAWMAEGLLDVNVIMNYKRDGVNAQGDWFDRWNAFAASQRVGNEEVAAGTAIYLNAPEVSASQTARAAALGLGWVGYSYRTPTSAVYNAAQPLPQGLAALKSALGAPGGVLEAPLAWKTVPIQRRALLGRVLGPLQAGGLRVSAYDDSGKLLASTTTDGNGYYGFSDLAGETGAKVGEMRVEVRVGDQRWAQALRAGVTRVPTLLLRTLVRTGP
ncbi:family 10 glycosylhydrolase [Deinococcus sp.]|uniref:glycoside hydrolase family 10 protein n=1 Tax=Deinococcus sp. TaxID=47478 RepID=UPI003CC551EB